MTGETPRTPLCFRPESVVQGQFANVWQNCWRQARIDLGAPNLHRTAGLMWSHLGADPAWLAPEQDVFVEMTVEAALEPEIFEFALYPGAKEFVGALAARGPLMFWSAGDMFGGTDPSGTFVSGSGEQGWRIRSSGVLERCGEQGHPVDVVAAEDKLVFVPHLFDWHEANGADSIIVFDDKLENLKQVASIVEETGQTMPVHLIWVRQGAHGDTTQETPDGMVSLRNISEAEDLLEQLALKNPGFLLDYDGVLSDDDLRQSYQQEAVFRRLSALGWLQNTAYDVAVHGKDGL